MAKSNKPKPQINSKGKPFTGVKRVDMKVLKLGMFNPTEELDKMNEGR
jgi:hypothetical protein